MGLVTGEEGSNHLWPPRGCWRAGLAQDLPSGPFLCCWLKEWGLQGPPHGPETKDI